MTEPEMDWLNAHFPRGYIIIVMQPNNVLSLMHNPQDRDGFTRMSEIIAKAQDMISDDLNPLLIEGP